MAFLEDRRVLFAPPEMEVPEHCVQSVREIRRFLSTELQSLDGDSELSGSLRALRAVCRRLMNTLGARSDTIVFGAHQGHWASWEFNGALGELREVFGIHIARLAAARGLDIEDELASSLPAGAALDEPE